MIRVGEGSDRLSIRGAYEHLCLHKELRQMIVDKHGDTDKIDRLIVETKKAIREYHRNNISDRRIVRNEYDACTFLIYLPDWIQTKEEAEDWFEVNEYLEAPNSQYDCTGALFTSWHYIAKRNGRWELWHSICADV